MTAITVTAGHIARGVCQDSTRCAVALAVLDAFPGIAEVTVGPSEISIKRSPGSRWADIHAPREMTFFILAFDDREPVEPFTFDLDYPAVTP